MEDYPKTYPTMRLKITCPDAWVDAMNLARENRDESLMNCVTRLLSWHTLDKDTEIVISKDFMDYSFYFVQIFSDGTTGINGGIIWSGKPSVKDGPFGYKYGLSIHT